ncbi:hypothetical protein NIES4073_45440 [Kalymmatonema gypsitolerans NIES-4073]|nr:hypothetical protein NIES4073_45440 [Scytonema sp. NIES-4073]
MAFSPRSNNSLESTFFKAWRVQTKLGFQILPEVELSFGFQQIRCKEAEAGLPIDQRVIMDLGQAMGEAPPGTAIA